MIPSHSAMSYLHTMCSVDTELQKKKRWLGWSLATKRWKGFLLKVVLHRSVGKMSISKLAQKINLPENYSVFSTPMTESGQTQWLWLRAGGDELTLSSPDIANP